jgi:hypothetical protein
MSGEFGTEPRRMPPENLAEVFAPDRGAEIRGALPLRNRRRPAPEAAADPTPPPVEVQAPVEASGKARGVTVYLPPKLAARVRAHRQRTKGTNAAVVLDAIDAAYARLPELLADSRTPVARPSGSLFPDRSVRRRRQPDRPVPLEF